MVERSLSMREVPGSIPGSSTSFSFFFLFFLQNISYGTILKSSPAAQNAVETKTQFFFLLELIIILGGLGSGDMYNYFKPRSIITGGIDSMRRI